MKKIFSSLLAFASLATFATAETATVGAPAPDFALKTASGEEVTLAGLKGKDVVLEWVNYGCPFVKKHYSEGHMQALQTSYTEQGVVWIQISSANESHPTYLAPTAFEEASAEHKAAATYSLVDADGVVGKAYNATTTPDMFIINKEGVLVYAGAIDSKKSTDAADIADSENYVVAALDAVLAGEPVKTAQTKPYGCGVKY